MCHKEQLSSIKIYSQPNFYQFDVCTVRLSHKEKTVRYIFLVVPGDSPALLGMPDIELLGILKIICEVVKGPQTDRKFHSQRMTPSSTLTIKTNTGQEIRSYNEDVINTISNMPDYFRFSTDKETDKRANQLITQRIQNEFSNVPTGIGYFGGIFRL